MKEPCAGDEVVRSSEVTEPSGATCACSVVHCQAGCLGGVTTPAVRQLTVWKVYSPQRDSLAQPRFKNWGVRLSFMSLLLHAS